MNELEIDWKQERPTSSEVNGIWTTIRLSRLANWSQSTNILKEKISETHCNGGIQVHKYKVSSNPHFDWFAQRNRLDEIDFLKNILKHIDLEDYRNDLEIKDNKPEIKFLKYATDIYELPGRLSRIMGLGGAYKKIDQRQAWLVATDFVRDEFENRFEEFNSYDFLIGAAQWFHDIAWDYSILLFDKRKYEIIFIDITDTD